MPKKIEKKVREIINSCINSDIDVDLIQLEDNLPQYGMNSISCIRLIVSIEDQYGFKVEDENLIVENFQSISKIVSYISKRI